MTRSAVRQDQAPTPADHCWPLHIAKARLSELVRLVHRDGPQRISTHGRVEVVVISADEYRRLKGDRSGAEVIAAFRASPHLDVDLGLDKVPSPVRDVEL